MTQGAVLRSEEALAQLPGPGGAAFAELFRHGTLSIEIYAPRGVDSQQPHDRDELYVVVSGSAEFVYGTDRRPVKRGDLLFVAAGVAHRFENFTEDLAVWVMFYGPKGGEAP